MKQVKIRFNTNYGKLENQKKWRVLIDDVQYFVDNIEVCCPCWTSEDIVQDAGKEIVKFHITCNPNKITFIKGHDILDNYQDADKVILNTIVKLTP